MYVCVYVTDLCELVQDIRREGNGAKEDQRVRFEEIVEGAL